MARKFWVLACDKKNLTKSLTREMPSFGDHFVDVEGNAKNRIIAREAAILAVVYAFIGEIQRSEQTHRSPKILKSERTRSLGHRFELLIRFRRDQVLETLDKLGFPQSEIIQYFDERHHHNFVCASTFATPIRIAQSDIEYRNKSGARNSGRRFSKCRFSIR